MIHIKSSDIQGCTATVTVVLHTNKLDAQLPYVPNWFSPNRAVVLLNEMLMLVL